MEIFWQESLDLFPASENDRSTRPGFRDETIMDVFEAIKGRRSVRDFLSDDFPWHDLEMILDMARYAPTAANAQPWRFLLVRNNENKANLKTKIKNFLGKKINGRDLTSREKKTRKDNIRQYVDNIFLAPVLVFVFVDASEYPDHMVYDGTLAVQNMMLAAHALGYGSCFQTTIFPEELVKEYFSVPNKYKFICTVPIGRATTQPEMPKKKDLSSFILEERFSS